MKNLSKLNVEVKVKKKSINSAAGVYHIEFRNLMEIAWKNK